MKREAIPAALLRPFRLADRCRHAFARSDQLFGIVAVLLIGICSPAAADTTAAAITSAPPSKQLLNISTRLRVLTGENVLIGGFILTGADPKQVLIRAIGPSLSAAGVPGALGDTVLELHDASGAVIASNDNWKDDAAQAALIRATGIPPSDDRESAIVATLPANTASYTAIVRGKNDGTGVGLVEVYDLAPSANSRLANISTRGFVDTGDNVMIGGFIVGGPNGQIATVVVRAIGPSLLAAGITNALADPNLELHDGNGVTVAADDNWATAQPADVVFSGLPPTDPREAAIVQTLAPGNYTAVVRGNNGTTGVALVEVYNLPSSVVLPTVIPDPVTQAPTPPPDHVQDFASSIEFLYNGSRPVQGGVAPGAITPVNAAVIRGVVKQADKSALPGVRVSVQGHPELGYTFSRADGQYDLAVAGGAILYLNYDVSGYLPAQRQVQTLQQSFARAEDVIMLPIDPVGTTIAFGASAPVQVANSSTQSDAAGSRSATLFFPAGTSATIINADGSSAPVTSLTVRATEYTVGPNGPARMPAQLPGTSEYTYCVAFSADEALNAGAKSVQFDRPVATYVENFLGFPVGATVPAGYYDGGKGAWVPSDNGIVFKLLSVNNGTAMLDVTGDDAAESDDVLLTFGITVAERQEIAKRFSAGQTFWRVPITHFGGAAHGAGASGQAGKAGAATVSRGESASGHGAAGDAAASSIVSGVLAWDYNFGTKRSEDTVALGDKRRPHREPKERGWGELGLTSQVFTEELPIAGTPFSLHYSSDRVPGYRVSSAIDLQLTKPQTPAGPGYTASLQRIDVKVTAAGRTVEKAFDPASDLHFLFQWDGRDAYHSSPADDPNLPPQAGSTMAHVEVVYAYPMAYSFDYAAMRYCGPDPDCYRREIAKLTAAFALPGAQTTSFVHAGTFSGVASGLDKELTVPDERRLGLGGWSLTPHHFYDPVAHILYRGDGEQIRTEAGGQTQNYVFLDKKNEFGRSPVAANPRTGEIFLVRNGSQVVKRTPDGNIVDVTAAGGTAGAKAISPMDRALDGMPASQVILSRDPDPTGVREVPTIGQLRFGSDDSLYLAFYSTIWRIDKDGYFRMVLCGRTASQYQVSSADGTLATEAFRGNETDGYNVNLAVATDGTVYYTEAKKDPTTSARLYLIRKITPDGRIHTIAGLGGTPPGDESADVGKPALTAHMSYPTGLAVGVDDSVYFARGTVGIGRIKPDGILAQSVYGSLHNNAGAGDDTTVATDDGKLGATAGVIEYGNPGSMYLNVSSNGSLYFYHNASSSIWQLDRNGVVHLVCGRKNVTSETGNALLTHVGAAYPYAAPDGMTVLPNGDIYYIVNEPDQTLAWRSLRKIGGLLPGFSGGDITVPSADGSELYVFDANGKHQRTIDTLFNVVKWLFSYDSNGFLTSIADRDGNLTRIERDGSGKPLAIVGPFGARTSLALDSNGFLAALTAPDQSKIALANSTLGLLQSITGERQEVYALTYDSQGRLIRGDHPNGGFTTLQRSGTEQDYTVTRTTAAGKVENRSKQVDGRRATTITLTDTDQPTTADPVQVDIELASGVTSSSSDGGKDVQTLASDPRPFFPNTATYFSHETFSLGSIATYDEGIAITAKNTNLDPFALTSFSIKSTRNGAVATTDFDIANLIATSHSWQGRTEETHFDAKGRPVSAKAGSLALDTATFDQAGRVVALTEGEGTSARQTTFSYDAGGFLNLVHPADNRDVHLTNDAMGRATSVTLPGNRTISWIYGPDGRPESITPPGRPAYSFQYDIPGRKTTFRTPALPGLDNATIYEQTFDRELKSITLPGGRLLNFTRRPSGKLDTITNTFGDSFKYSYDSFIKTNGVGSAQFLRSIAQPSGQSVTFDWAGPEVYQTTWAGPVTGRVARNFNGFLRYSSETLNGDSSTGINFTYDQDALMTAAGSMTLTWRSDVPLLASTKLDSITTATAYDVFGFLSNFAAQYSGSNVLTLAETYDNAAHLTDETITVSADAPLTLHYDYDAAGFLASVKKNGVVAGTYTYDQNGNLTAETGPGGNISYTYDLRDRLITAGNRSFAYTDADELKTKVGPEGTTSYTYDEFGQLRKVILPDTRVITYSLGLPGVRLAKSINGTRVKAFLLDDKGTIMAELNGSNAIVSRFVYTDASRSPSCMLKGTDIFRLLTDASGSVRLVVNTKTGAVAQRIDYDAWGKVTSDSNPGFQPFGYAGGLYDPDTGLVQFNLREYDASIRRWTTADPIGFTGGSTNLFVYVDNDPINGTDSSGTGPAERERRRKHFERIQQEAQQKIDREIHQSPTYKTRNFFVHTLPHEIEVNEHAIKHLIAHFVEDALEEAMSITNPTSIVGGASDLAGAGINELTGDQLDPKGLKLKGVDASGPNRLREREARAARGNRP